MFKSLNMSDSEENYLTKHVKRISSEESGKKHYLSIPGLVILGSSHSDKMEFRNTISVCCSHV